MHQIKKKFGKKKNHINDKCILNVLIIFISFAAFSTIIPFLPNANKFPMKTLKPLLFNITLHKQDSHHKYMIDLHRGAFFVNANPSVCPYDNSDRLTFIMPLIDNILNICRDIKVPIIQNVLPLSCDSGLCEKQIANGIKSTFAGHLILGDVQGRSSEISKHIETFASKTTCSYSSYDNNSYTLSMNENDVFIKDIHSAVYAFAGVGAKFVFISGESLNKDIIYMIHQVSHAGITPIIVEGLVDNEYSYNETKKKFKNHSDFLKKSIHALTNGRAYSTTYSELISALNSLYLHSFKYHNHKW